MARSSMPASRKQRVARMTRLAGIVALLGAAFVPTVAAYPLDPNWAPPSTVYIPQTGQTIDGLFLDLWRTGGGALSYGNPITPEITEDEGQIVQYYEYARFEYWPQGDENGNYVVLGEVGKEPGPPLLAPRFATRGLAAPPVDMEVVRAWQPVPSAVASALVFEQPTYRYVPETEHGVWGGFRAWWEATGEAAYIGNPISEEYVQNGVSEQVFERGKLRWREGEDITMAPVGALLAERFGFSMEPSPQGNVPVYDEALFVPPIPLPDFGAAPPAPGGGRAVVVSLGQQALWAYENGEIVRSTYVSTGTEKFRTPPGYFTVNTKVPVQDMAGVIGGEFYDVPNVPNVLYFTDRDHAIHGTYRHENFGTTMSHGCINLPMDVAEWMYAWAPVGMAVVIVE